MSSIHIAVLGIIAGFTIFLGLPIGRLTRRSPTLVAALNALTIGVLVFLLWDVFSHAVEPVELSLKNATTHSDQWGTFAALSAVFVLALGTGMIGLVGYDRMLHKRSELAKEASVRGVGQILRLHDPASRLAYLIAVGIGLHNFSEGLAIGQSAAGGQISLAIVLVVGFALHNATEGFGITAPMAGSAQRPSWLQLAVLGIIGGLPTLIGTLLGSIFVNELVSVLFLALAAGSIFYVIVQLMAVAQRLQRKYTLFIGAFGGIIAGFATDFIITAAGV